MPRSVVRWAVAVALLSSGCTGDGTTAADPPTSTPSPRGSPTPSPRPTGPLAFVLARSYVAGMTVPVRLHNDGDVGYEFNPSYEACDLTYRDEAGRKFLVPEGTHCDLISTEVVRPGKTVTLFEWDLDECTKDEWGCMRDRPLPPGTYTISGRFRPAGGGRPVRAEATFAIAPR
jgi:hypothetical protein